MSLIKSISKEVYKLIYKFINPTSMKSILEKKIYGVLNVERF